MNKRWLNSDPQHRWLVWMRVTQDRACEPTALHQQSPGSWEQEGAGDSFCLAGFLQDFREEVAVEVNVEGRLKSHQIEDVGRALGIEGGRAAVRP